MRAASRHRIAPSLVLLSALLCAAPRWAGAQEEEPPPEPAEPGALGPVESAGLLETLVGAGHLLTLPVPVERVALADETVARVQLISTREALITGLVPGKTTFFAWLTDGRRLRYLLQVGRDLDPLRRVLRDLDRRIAVRASPDGSSVVLSGDVADEPTARHAVAMTEELLRAPGAAGRGVQVVDLLRFPKAPSISDLALTEALRQVDSRIRVRRIQVGPQPAPERDSYVLEGRVRNVKALIRAVILAERQLGGAGVRVSAPAAALTVQRSGGFAAAGTGAIQGGNLPRPPAGLAAQLARGLVITSESGRVLSLLAVDELPQIMVSIRVYEIDRNKAKRIGINFRFDSDHLSLGSVTGPQGGLPRLLGGSPTVSGISGNLAAAFVDQTFAIAAAIDFLQSKELARSVSEPNILALSGEEATVLVGGEVPIPNTAVGQSTTVQGFSFQSFGVQLDIRPTVDEEGVIALEVSPSIIRPAPGLAVGGVPGFQIQSVQTTARVPAGQSLVLGGLLSFDEGLEESRVPLLGRLPLFRWRRNSRQEQELLFVITPRLVAMPEVPPVPPIPAAGPGEIGLPVLDWPAGRDDWRDPFEPQILAPDGLPPGFRRDVEGLPPVEPVPPAPPPETAKPAVEEHPPTAEAVSVEDAPLLPPPEPRPAAERWQVRENLDPCLVLRSEPSLAGERFDCLAPGTGVVPLEQAGEWWRIELDDGRSGWVVRSYLTPAPAVP